MRTLVTLAMLLTAAATLHGQSSSPTPADTPASADAPSPLQPMEERKPFGAEDTTTIHIRLVNGKTGQPIADKEIFLERSKMHLMSHAEEHDIKTDATGLAEATVAKTGSVLNPIVVDYKSCTPRTKQGIDTEKAERFPIAAILTTGVVAPNTCGKTAHAPIPGELTLYFRPLNVFERITD